MEIEILLSIFLKHKVVVTDSRAITPGCIFFALKGENFNGNQFAVEALSKGAAYAVVDDKELPSDDRLIFTPDVLRTLQDLARIYRRSFQIPVLAITGSNGKTTTKELVSRVLGTNYRVHYTQGNLNNHIGVPLTLLSMPADTEIAVIEMGANHQGEIDQLAHIAEPTHGLITNIGKAHLEGFGGLEGVKKGKSELYRFLNANGGLLFINTDEPWLEELAGKVNQVVRYGKKQSDKSAYGQFTIVDLLATQPYLTVAFKGENGNTLTVESQLVGAYNYPNVATAIAVGLYFKVPGIKIKASIEAYMPTMMRSQLLHKGGNTFILDAYNANPSSMQEAILNLKTMETPRKIAILGDMLELGEFAAQEHEHIARLALAQNFELTVFVGPLFSQANLTDPAVSFPDVEALSQWFKKQQLSNAFILLKGSRGMRMEKLLDDL